MDYCFKKFIIPNGCNIEFHENVFNDCSAEEVSYSKRYVDICKKVFINAKIIVEK